MNVELIQNLLKGSVFKGENVKRINYLGRRAYVAETPFRVYSGLTSAMDSATFKGDMSARRLSTWKESMIEKFASIEKFDQFMDATADAGTALHEALVDIWNDQMYEFNEEKAREMFMESDKKIGIEHDESLIRQRVLTYHKNVASLMQFVHDEMSDIIAIEVCAYSDEYKICTPLDIVYKDKKGVMCAVNMKTSKQISDHQIDQVSFEKYLWNTCYPDYKVEKTGVFRPQDWRLKKGVPTYELKFVSDADERVDLMQKRFKACMADPNSTYANFDKTDTYFTGKIKLGEAPKIVTKTIEQAFVESQQVNQ